MLEVHLDLGGYPVTVLDTAGIRETDDPVEQEGVRRANEQAAHADLVLWIVDATVVAPPNPLGGADRWVRVSAPTWLVVNKIDLIGARGSRM